MNKYILVAFSVTAGLLSALAWSGWCTGLILLASFIPFFLIEEYLFEHNSRYSINAFFIYSLPGFLIFSILTLGWIREASLVGSIFVITGMTFLFSFTAWLVHLVRIRMGSLAAITALASLWLSFELICLNVDIITPWVNLGNGLAKDIMFIQWYDTTGVAGGTLWILFSNLLLVVMIKGWLDGSKRMKLYIALWIIIIAIPAAISLTKYFSPDKETAPASEVVIIQPDFDPYSEKFSIPFTEQLKIVLNMAEEKTGANTSWVITPETTVDDPVDEESTLANPYIQSIKEFTARHPSVSFVTGMTTFRTYPPSPDPPTRSARKIEKDSSYYDHFNSALMIDTGATIKIYHKSKLVPGIEKQFLTGAGKLLTKILPSLGGTSWGYGTQKERTGFMHRATGVKAGPVICYESVYGDYLTGYVKKGANAIFIITNDGWWKNTNGYKQHFSFASMRAIETRRPVARAANTGISGIIDKRGKVMVRSRWWTPAVLKGEIKPSTELTFYARHGDYLMRIAAIIAALLLLALFIIMPLYRKFKTGRRQMQP